MIKGVRWYFVVLFSATSVWIASSLNVEHPQKRQTKNIFFPLTSLNDQYLLPIPIRVPPHFQRGPQRTSGRSVDKGQSPWIPMHGSQGEDVNNKNVYVPPIRPPVATATRIPAKVTFDIPLTKSIQVSQGRPNIQTTGYIRKNLVKLHATRTTTTERPRHEAVGTLAESTVQTLLNFTPVDEGWRPKSVTAPTTTTTAPNSQFAGKTPGWKVQKHLNYTGVRFGKNNTVLKSMPPNGRAVRLSKNETNYVMKFTPEDIKYSSVEVKTEGIHAPFPVDGPETQHFTGGLDERRPFFDVFSNHMRHIPEKSAADLRNEGNIPYQGHKASMENIHGVFNNPLNMDFKDSNEDHKNIPDIFSQSKKKKINLHGQDSFVNIPFGTERPNSQYAVRQKNINMKDRTFVSEPFDRINVQKEEINKPVSGEDNRNFFSHPSKAYTDDSDQQVKSNLPYQGHATKPPGPENSYFGSKINLSDREQQQAFIPTPASKNIYTNGEIINNKYFSDQKAVPNFPVSHSPQHAPDNYSANVQLLNNKNSSTMTSSHTGNYQYDLVLNSFPANKATEKDAINVIEVPLNTGIRENKSPPSIAVVENVEKNNHGPSNPPNKNFKHLNNPSKSPPDVPITHQDIRSIYDNKNREHFSMVSQIPNKPAFEEEPTLKEVELKNPPKYLQFHDNDFLKPVIPINQEKYTDKSSSTGAGIKEADKQNSDTSRNTVEHSKSQIPTSKIEYYDNSKSDEKKLLEDSLDNTYFQPLFPDTPPRKTPDTSRQVFQNFDNHPTSAEKKKDISRTNVQKDESKSPVYEKENHLSTLQKISKDVIITKDSPFSPKDTRRNGIQRDRPGDFPSVVTPPPVITMSYDSSELHNDNNGAPNRTENYAIHLKPVLLPESSGRPRKPKITISTGMLAGILIAALVFLGFLTGSIVYAFHQWKFGRSRNDRQKKKTRNPGFPPEFLDDNLAGNTYIHNNIFLPTPQNLEERNPSDPDNNSMIADEEHPAASTRGRRLRRTEVTRREC